MSQSVYFNGETIIIPGAYSAIDTSQMSTKTNTGANIIALIGECAGGEPGAVQFFSDTITAKKVLKSGELLKACEKAWNPVSKTKAGVSLGGANIIAAIRSNDATKSTLTIEKEGHKQLQFQSKDWGKNTNYEIKITDGTLEGTKNVIVFDPVNNQYETLTSIGNAFAIAYKGDQKYAELNIFKDGQNSMYFQTKVGTSKETAVEDISVRLDPTRIKTLYSLISELKSYENYVVSSSNTFNNHLKVTDLDFVNSADIKLTEDNTYRVTAIYADIKYRLETRSQLVELVDFDKTQGEIENFEYNQLTGGTEGSSPASWVEFFDALSNFDISYIVPLTSNTSIHSELAAHVSEMSGNLGKERRGIVGGAIGESVDDSITRANNLASHRMQVVHGGFYDINEYGEMELYPPYILAAQHAGRAAYLTGGESATHDVYRMVAPEFKLERSEIIQLLNGGVIPFEFVLTRNSTVATNSYVRLVRDLTTDITNDDSLHTERATGALADDINREIRDVLDERLTGKRATSSDLTSASNAVVSILSARKNRGDILDFKDVSVIKSSTTIEIDYSVAPTEPNNFTLITAHYYSETIGTTI